MPKRRQIKFQILVFIVLLIAFTGMSVVLFKLNFDQFRANIFEKAHNNILVLNTLNEIDTSLYVYERSLKKYLNTGKETELNKVITARDVLRIKFHNLEDYNKKNLNEWVVVEGFAVEKVQHELRELIFNSKQSGEYLGDHNFQRLFYLLTYAVETYFKSSEGIIKKYEQTSVVEDKAFDVPEQNIDLIFAGVSEIKNAYNKIFWDFEQDNNDKFRQNTQNYFIILTISCLVLLFFSIRISIGIIKLFNSQQQKDEDLIILGTRDLTTGLFTRRSLESILSQEIQRAKRRNYSVTVLMVRVEPYEQIKETLGKHALDRLIYQISNVLRGDMRAYDGIFKFDENTFVLYFPETDPKVINKLIQRIRRQLQAREFVVKSDQTKITPIINMGAASYPHSGKDYISLIKIAESMLSEEFDAKMMFVKEEVKPLSKKESARARIKKKKADKKDIKKTDDAQAPEDASEAPEEKDLEGLEELEGVEEKAEDSDEVDDKEEVTDGLDEDAAEEGEESTDEESTDDGDANIDSEKAEEEKEVATEENTDKDVGGEALSAEESVEETNNDEEVQTENQQASEGLENVKEEEPTPNESSDETLAKSSKDAEEEMPEVVSAMMQDDSGEDQNDVDTEEDGKTDEVPVSEDQPEVITIDLDDEDTPRKRKRKK